VRTLCWIAATKQRTAANQIAFSVTPQPTIAILLCTFNGQDFLPEQLDSIAAQQGVHWVVWASDDGSSDQTRDILRRYQRAWGEEKLQIIEGPRRGFVANFLDLLALDAIKADFFAFSDQDDVWHPEKLSAAAHALSAYNSDEYLLYGSRTRLIDDQGQHLGWSPLFLRTPGFANALVQSIAGGNTLLFNASARKLLAQARPQAPLVTHDWWAYLVVTACGGRMIYDAVPRIDYRQHRLNLVGMNVGLLPTMRRIAMLLAGYFKLANDQNIQALGGVRAQLTGPSLAVLEAFETARGPSNMWVRGAALWKSGVYRQTWIGQAGLWFALIFRRI
jgi:glycosyltransferase involved in cell wall biosynthesis